MRLSYALGTGVLFLLTTITRGQAPTPQAQNKVDPRVNHPGSPTPIYQMNDVAKSLNLTPEQVNRLNTQTADIQKRYADDFNKLNSLSGAERAQQQNDLNRRYNADWMKSARDILNENQISRYQQLQYQYGGFGTFNDPDVQKRLNLTDEQRNNLRQLNDWSSQQMQDINRLGATDAQKATQLHGDYQRQYQERFNKFLTPEQQRTWQQMTGEPYRFQPSFTTQPRR